MPRPERLKRDEKLGSARVLNQLYRELHGGNIATLIDSATFWPCYLSMGSDEDGLASARSGREAWVSALGGVILSANRARRSMTCGILAICFFEL
jgi:hypothetical protein